MRIALLADVHANLSALKVVLDHARENKAEEFWNLGDMVGYGPFPDECVKLLHATCKYSIIGNHDEKALSKKKIEKMREKGKDPDKVFSFEWTHQHLSEEAAQIIRSFPEIQPVDVEGHRVLITHGSPEGIDDDLVPETPQERLIELAALTDAQLVLCGHTHRFFDRTAGKIRFVNPGGVGRSFDGDSRASYCILDISSKGIEVEHFRLDYDLQSLVREMTALAFPERVVRSLVEARSLEELDDLASSAGAAEVVARALDVGARCKFEKEHALKVTALALMIFDGLRDVHALTEHDRLYLQCAAVLHDVGFPEDPSRHNKVSRDIILQARELPLSRREKVIVGLTARYHRGGLPDNEHRYYSELTGRDRHIVDMLAGILRVADGLDRSHRSLVKDMTCEVSSGTVTLLIGSSAPCADEAQYALLKGDLLQKVLKKVLVVRKR